jgi:hypothetical protein
MSAHVAFGAKADIERGAAKCRLMTHSVISRPPIDAVRKDYPTGSTDLAVGILKRDHIATGYSNPLGGHGWSTASHVPGSVGLAERAFRKQTIHRVDHEIAALGGSRAGAKTDTLG